jgi:hypothetical protein
LWSVKIFELQGPLGNPRFANTQCIRKIAIIEPMEQNNIKERGSTNKNLHNPFPLRYLSVAIHAQKFVAL